MKLNWYIWVLLLVLLPLAGCIDDDFSNGRGVDLGGDVEFVMNADLPGNGDLTPSTYATEAQEHRLGTIDVLVFKEDGAAETFLYATHASDIKNGTSANGKVFKVMLKKTTAGERHRIVLLANLRDEVDAVKTSFAVGVTTKSAALESVEFSSSGSKWSISAFPMWGETPLSSVAAGMVFSPVQLLRSIARIDLGINMTLLGGEYEPQGSPLLKIGCVKVYNTNNLGCAAPAGTNYGNKLPTIPVMAAVNAAVTYDSMRLVNGFIRDIYTTEYNNRSQADRADLMCLVVGGYYTAPGSGTPNESVMSWYRVDLDTVNTSTGLRERMDVLRNYRYIVNIHTINGEGNSSEAAALNAAGEPSLGVDVIPWDEAELSGGLDGDYWLTISQTLFKFKPTDSRTVADGDNKVTLTTGYSGGWQVDRIVDDSGNPITGAGAWLQTNITQGAAHTPAIMSLLLTANPGAERVGYIYISAGRWCHKIQVRQ